MKIAIFPSWDLALAQTERERRSKESHSIKAEIFAMRCDAMQAPGVMDGIER